MLTPPPSVAALSWGPARYEAAAPFSPGTAWPEYASVARDVGPAQNGVYTTVRESFRLLGLDLQHCGTERWNPLGAWIRPGNTVVIKPNFVRDFRESHPDDGDCLITHGAVIRAVLDYAYLALQGRGRLVIADAPQSDADFDGIRRITGLDAMAEFYRQEVGFPVEVYDLRPEAAEKVDGVIVSHRRLPGDPAGYVRVDLGRYSAVDEIQHLCAQLYGSEYDRAELVSHHRDGRHEYLIARTVLDADCVISVPKLKTHKKVGLTVNLKNLVGINGNKNWLPHHREGTPAQGGDQFAEDGLLHRTERGVMAVFRKCFPLLGPFRAHMAAPLKVLGRRVFGDTNTDTVRSGNWYGNDTTWRMVLDLNRLLLYADATGALHPRPVRRFLSVVDGIIGGEGSGPLDPRPRPAGLIVAGTNPVAVDLACARLMGFDYQNIPMLTRALAPHPLPLADFGYADVVARSNDPSYDCPLTDLLGRLLAFAPHFGWAGHVEVTKKSHEAGVLA
jgi:uncharacterized protein (DUF362 family)